jgi:hypothetical protein
MTIKDIELILYYLSKVVVPQTEQEQFMKAFNSLETLKNRAKQKAA